MSEIFQRDPVHKRMELFRNCDQTFSRFFFCFFFNMKMKFCCIYGFPLVMGRLGKLGGKSTSSLLRKQETAGATSCSWVLSREKNSSKRTAISSPRETLQRGNNAGQCVFRPLGMTSCILSICSVALGIGALNMYTQYKAMAIRLHILSVGGSVAENGIEIVCVCACVVWHAFPWLLWCSEVFVSAMVSFGVLFVGLQWKPHWEPRLHVAILGNAALEMKQSVLSVFRERDRERV